MENRRRNNNRRSQNRRPPRGTSGNWQPTVPSWEKEFCRVIGSMDWENILQTKKFMHLYENVIKWDDSAGEEAFTNAKKRFWAEINGFPCDIPLPDPDLYIDEIDWDSETCPQLLPDFDSEPVVAHNVEVNHEPVVIFGDTLLPNEGYTLSGWGDDDENFKAAAQANTSSANQGSPWVQNWGNSFDNGTATGWADYSNSAWNFGDGSGAGGYMTWGNGWNNEWGWNYNNDATYGAQPHMEQGMADGGWGQWNDNGGNVSTDNGYKTTYWGQQSCGPSNHHSAITVGQAWHQ